MRRLVFTGLVWLVAGCAQGPSLGSTDQAISSRAEVELSRHDTSIAQTSAVGWTLTKTGAVDATSHVVTWTITAAQSATATHQVIIAGQLEVENHGHEAATVGNLVVNLATRTHDHHHYHHWDHDWTTVASDVTDATSGDAATSANVVEHGAAMAIGEGPGAGSITLSDPDTGAAESLVPERAVAPHHEWKVAFTATFDNDALQLAPGTKVQVDVIVTTGNASEHGGTAADVDANGNGVIDPDEAFVASAHDTLDLHVPAPQDVTATPTIEDSAADITTTDTATFSNAQFNLGATDGTASVTYQGGADGGTITNCAHLTSPDSTVTVGAQTITVPGVDLQACDTETVAADAYWRAGDLVTYTEVEWAGDPASSPAAQDLYAHYNAVYAATSEVFEIGIIGAGGKSIRFTDVDFLHSYLPTVGSPAALPTDYVNPSSTPAGDLGGEIAALKLNVNFGDAHDLVGSTGLRFGDLTICATGDTAIDGKHVRNVLAIANTLLGGGPAQDTIARLYPNLIELDASFDSGTPSQFAQDHLVNGSCP